MTPTALLPVVTDNCGNNANAVCSVTGGTYADVREPLLTLILFTDCEGNTNDWVYTYTSNVNRSLIQLSRNNGGM